MDRVRRIAFVAALAASAALALPGLAGAATQIGVEDDFFSPKRATLTVGESDVSWRWDLDGSSGGATDSPHDVVSRDDLFETDLRESGRYERRASAGSFAYFCSIHSGMTGKLRVKPRVDVRGEVTAVVWAERGSNTGDRFDVQMRENGRWRELQEASRRRSIGFGAAERERRASVELRARSQGGRGSERQSGWSPPVRVDLD